MRLFPLLVGLLPAMPLPAIAANRWEAGATAAVVVLGPAERQTGGVMPGLSVRHVWSAGDHAELGLGAQVGAFGFGDETRWIGVLGGLHGSAAWRPIRGLSLSGEFDADVGRIPICNPWGLCLRFIGLFPSFNGGVTWHHGDRFALRATAGVRVVEALAWSGIAGQGGVSGVVSW